VLNTSHSNWAEEEFWDLPDLGTSYVNNWLKSCLFCIMLLRNIQLICRFRSLKEPVLMTGAVYKTETPSYHVLKTSEEDRGNFRFVAEIYTENLYWIFSRNVKIFGKCSSLIINLGPSLWFAVEIFPVVGCRHQVEMACVGEVSVKYADFKHRIKGDNMFLRNVDNTARFHKAPNTQQRD